MINPVFKQFKWLRLVLCFAVCACNTSAFTQDVNPLIKKLKAKLDKVNDYTATGRMKTDVPFIKAPPGDVQIFYKKPDQFKLKRSNGIYLLPKGGVFVNMNDVLGKGNFMALAAGESMIGSTKVTIIKLLPANEAGEIALTTLYIDETNLLIRKTSTTTKENGTYEMEMTYGAYGQFGLPDKVTFYFSTKDFKLPKGLTMEFDTGEERTGKPINKKGKVEITYSSYRINKGVPGKEFN